jgi:hypothetical protein
MPHPTATGTENQPHPVHDFPYRPAMEGTRLILWANLSALMKAKWGKENLTQLRLKAGVGASAMSEMKEGTRSVGTDVLDKLAEAFDVQPYQLLMPDLGASLLQWPFKHVTRERLLSLRAEDLRYVEGRLDEMLRQLEGVGVPAKQAIQQARVDAMEGPVPEPPAPSPSPSGKRHHKSR